jgi:hypothetical protein
MDVHGRPYGCGYGTWASWWLPVVWISPPNQQFPAWFDKLPAGVQRHARDLYSKLFASDQDQQQRQQMMNGGGRPQSAAEGVTLVTFAWHKTTLIQLLLDQADHLQRIKSNAHSTLYYNGAGGFNNQPGGFGGPGGRFGGGLRGSGGGGGGETWRSVEGPPRRLETITFGPEVQCSSLFSRQRPLATRRWLDG